MEVYHLGKVKEEGLGGKKGTEVGKKKNGYKVSHTLELLIKSSKLQQ